MHLAPLFLSQLLYCASYWQLLTIRALSAARMTNFSVVPGAKLRNMSLDHQLFPIFALLEPERVPAMSLAAMQPRLCRKHGDLAIDGCRVVTPRRLCQHQASQESG